MNINKSKRIFFLISVFVSIVWIIVLNVLPLNSTWARFLVDKGDGNEVNYMAVQNYMWVSFFIGIALIIQRFYVNMHVKNEMKLFAGKAELFDNKSPFYDFLTHLSMTEGYTYIIHVVLVVARELADERHGYKVPHFDNVIDEVREEIDVEYNMIRYVAWCLPTLGFTGTVLGVLRALDMAGRIAPDSPQFLPLVIGQLSTAFWTTLLGLLLTLCLMFLMHLSYNAEERVLIRNCRYIRSFISNFRWSPNRMRI